MNTPKYIAKRLLRGGSQKKATGLMVNISVFGIALSVAVMIIAVAITTGFKEEIGQKATGFAADIQITFSSGSPSIYNMDPISASQPFLCELEDMPDIRHIQQFCIKPGIMKSAQEIQGIVLKGIGKDFEWDFFQNNLVEGDIFHISDTTISNEIVISKHIAGLLQLELGDELIIYFVQQPPRARRLTISGIYNTGLVELDQIYALVDMRHIQNINNWEPDQISGFEIFINNFNRIERVTDDIFDIIWPSNQHLEVHNIRQMYSQIFDWLRLQDTTVAIILIVMAIVAGFNMISGLLIIIIERTSTIGILKAMGADNRFIRKIFRHKSAYFVQKGLLWGNIIALTLCFLQMQFGLLSLDQESYFIDKVPISISLLQLVLINIFAMIWIRLMLLLPPLIISKISPETTMRYR